LTSLVRREIFLEAVFLCIKFFRAALSISEITFFKAAWAASAFLPETSFSTFFESVFRVFFAALFFRVNSSVCRARLRTDLLFFGAAFAGN